MRGDKKGTACTYNTRGEGIASKRRDPKDKQMHPGRRFPHWKFIAQAKVRWTLWPVSPYRESSHQRFRAPFFPGGPFFLSFLPSFFPPPANRERGNPPRPRVMRFYESQSGLGRPGFPSRSATSRDTNQRFQFFFFFYGCTDFFDITLSFKRNARLDEIISFRFVSGDF